MNVSHTPSIPTMPCSVGKEDLSGSPVSVMQTLPTMAYVSNTTNFALAPTLSTSPSQHIQSSSTPPTPLHVLHPVAAEVLQRTENNSAWDVESYVRALGNKKYAAVKELRRVALLTRAKEESGVSSLNEATIRKQTNLASAEASRAKKEFILEQLYAQLKKKNEDAIILAKELRRVLSIIEQMNNTRQMEAYLQHQRGQTHSAYVAQLSHTNTAAMSAATHYDNQDTSVFHEEHTNLDTSGMPSQSNGELDKSMYDALMHTSGGQHESNYGIDDNTAVSANAFDMGHPQQNMINFPADAMMEMDMIVREGTFENDVIDEKSFGDNSNVPRVQYRSYHLNESNPNDRFVLTS